MNKFFLYGLAGTGKDTVAEVFWEQHMIAHLALADPIREEYVRFFGSDDFKRNRQRMIKIGETYKEIYGQDVWCAEAVRRIERPLSKVAKGFLIRDGRYPHEYDYFTERGFIPVKVVSDDVVRVSRLIQRDGMAQQRSLDYEKEHFIPDDNFAYVIENNGSMAELEQKISYLMYQLHDQQNKNF